VPKKSREIKGLYGSGRSLPRTRLRLRISQLNQGLEINLITQQMAEFIDTVVTVPRMLLNDDQVPTAYSAGPTRTDKYGYRTASLP
jgi:hypothetical protein